MLKLNYSHMYLEDSKIIVIKIGSSLLIDDNKKIRKKWLLEFAKDIRELVNKIMKNFSKDKSSEVVTLSTLEKGSVSKIKAKLLSYVS